MIEVSTESAHDDRLSFSVGVAEQLPYPDGTFDLVVSSTSFDHWSDQQTGLRECARVLRPGGRLVLVDQFSLSRFGSRPPSWRIGAARRAPSGGPVSS